MKKVILLSVVVLMGFAVVAQTGKCPKVNRGDQNGQRNGDRKVEMVERLSLTESQQKQIDDLRLTHRSACQDFRNEIDIKQAQLKALVASDQPDTKKVGGLVKDINDLRGKEFQKMVDHQLEVRAVLDDKQKVVFDDMPFGQRERRNRY